MPQKEDKGKIGDPLAVALAEMFDKALDTENKMLFQQAFSKLYEWALTKLTLPRIPDVALAGELVQGAMIAVYKKSQRVPLQGEDFTRIVYTHLLGSKKAERKIPGVLRKYKKGRAKTLSIDEFVPNTDESISKSEMIPDNAPNPEKTALILHTKKEEAHLLLNGLKAEICKFRQKSKKYEQKVETLVAFRNYVSTKLNGLLDEELIHLQICIVSAGRTQKILDPELSNYLQKKLKLDQNAVRQRVNRHILKSPTVMGLLEGYTR